MHFCFWCVGFLALSLTWFQFDPFAFLPPCLFNCLVLFGFLVHVCLISLLFFEMFDF